MVEVIERIVSVELCTLLVNDSHRSIVELECVVLTDETHVIGLLVVQILVGDDVHVLFVSEDDIVEDLHRGLCEVNKILSVALDLVLLFLRDSR